MRLTPRMLHFLNILKCNKSTNVMEKEMWRNGIPKYLSSTKNDQEICANEKENLEDVAYKLKGIRKMSLLNKYEWNKISMHNL